jgi:hypothetical protein
MILVTLHGGNPGKHPLQNNVHAHDKEGKMITRSVLQDTEGVILNELRGIDLVGNLLYVANANRTQNSLLCFEGADTCYRLVSRFASREMCRVSCIPSTSRSMERVIVMYRVRIQMW